MSINSILTTAYSGLNVATAQVQAAAQNITNAHTSGYKPVEVSSVSLVTRGAQYSGGGVQANFGIGDVNEVNIGQEFINLIQAEIAYKASAQILKTSAELERTLLDIST